MLLPCPQPRPSLGGTAGSETGPFPAQCGADTSRNDFNPSLCFVFLFQKGDQETGDFCWAEVREEVWAQGTEERLPVPNRPLLWDADNRYLLLLGLVVSCWSLEGGGTSTASRNQ